MYLHAPLYSPVLISFSGAILYWLATNLCTAFSSSKNNFIRMNGSLPFCVSMCHGFGLARRSDTLPWERPSTDSPNRRWLIEYWERISFIWKEIIMQLFINILELCSSEIHLLSIRQDLIFNTYPSHGFVSVKVGKLIKLLLCDRW